jgi:hypothetical protein
MGKVLLEYEQCQCSKLQKAVTITSMVFEESGQTALLCATARQAFDCDQKNSCGVLTVSGKSRRVNWAGCTHPKLAQKLEAPAG